MRTASELVRATRPYAREVRWRSWWHLGSTLAVLTGLFVLTAVELPWPCRLAASALAGLALIRMFIIFHDYHHGTILRGAPLAGVVLAAFGVLFLTPRSIWRRSHQSHHRQNARLPVGGIGTFPIMTTQEFARASWRDRCVYALKRHPVTMLAGYATVFLCGMCLGPALRRPRRHADAALALALHAAAVVALAVYAPQALVWTLLVPMALAAALGAYLFYAQHNFPAAVLHDRASWDFTAAALAGASYIPMNPVLRWFTGNIGYHHVHHLNARIPFYRLPEAMGGVVELQSPGVTTLSPRAIYRCLRLKLWDPDLRRLVDFRGQ